MKNYNQTMKLLTQIDELALEILAKSGKELPTDMTALKLLEDEKEPIIVNGTVMIFMTPNNVSIDISLVPLLIAKN